MEQPPLGKTYSKSIFQCSLLLMKSWVDQWCYLCNVRFSHTYYITHFFNNSPVDAPIAPMSTAGIAITMQPKAARNDKTWAYVAEDEERTRWKYACHGIPPNVCKHNKQCTITGCWHQISLLSSYREHIEASLECRIACFFIYGLSVR